MRVIQGTNRLAVRLAAAPSAFKYVSYVALRDPERLVVDLWKSAQPAPDVVRLRAAEGQNRGAAARSQGRGSRDRLLQHAAARPQAGTLEAPGLSSETARLPASSK